MCSELIEVKNFHERRENQGFHAVRVKSTKRHVCVNERGLDVDKKEHHEYFPYPFIQCGIKDLYQCSNCGHTMSLKQVSNV